MWPSGLRWKVDPPPNVNLNRDSGWVRRFKQQFANHVFSYLTPNLNLRAIFLTPFELARKAMRLMDTNRGPATRARPLGLFAPDKTPYPGSPHGLEVLDHAHPVFRPVTLVNVCQQFAREA